MDETQTCAMDNVVEEKVSHLGAEKVPNLDAEMDSDLHAENVSDFGAEDVSNFGDQGVSNVVNENISNVGVENVSNDAVENVANVGTENVSNAGAENVSNDENVETDIAQLEKGLKTLLNLTSDEKEECSSNISQLNVEDSVSDGSENTPKKIFKWADICESESPMSSKSGSSTSSRKGYDRGVETDVSVLKRRQKQISYGKCTAEYKRYMECVPKFKRQPFHVKTPNKYLRYSRRSWDNLIRQWRKRLHCYDNENPEGNEDIRKILEPILKKNSPSVKEQDKNKCSKEASKVATKLVF